MRLDKFLSHTGFGSRKEVKQLLKKKVVRVNDQVVKKGDYILNLNQDHISVNGETITYQEFIYLMLNKPAGYLSATEDNFQKTVIDLLQPEEQHFNPFPVGRLDKDTEGLLLLTNDGELAHFLLSPKKHVKKTYYAEVVGVMDLEDIERFKLGIVLEDGYKCLPAELQIIEQTDRTSKVLITVEEGKFHQVKRMVLACGKEVNYLKRQSMASLKLDETLKSGEYRPLDKEELDQLKEFLPQDK
ncbi:Ribosomal large subunit pseudouridine synthase B [Jeotgalibaca dankookensis]|uniref:Pseudouridine synthase n=1 Tax=Jeotgalibaca dankookensis TaxID=708126 RepID=A0A1S6IP50_9LACT|nr:pseudouridine synthase [Jeotgalibaca dankookensis]AQS53345.1 Ribosomal large subunit pseudouridine synthase B [Jeotgalibaca dankookensis]